MKIAGRLWPGVLFWGVFSFAAVALRGVRWEETWEHALVITRAVPYPEGHPFFQYCRNVFSGQSYLSALLFKLIDCPILLNGYRNVLQLSFCTVPVFLLSARFGRSAWGGHLAVVFVLAGLHQGFQSYYPIESWPHFFATGQIGAGWAVLIFTLLLGGGWRIPWLLLGLMPVIHIGQLPVIGLFAGVLWLQAICRRDFVRVGQAILWFGVGLVPCVVFFVIQRQFHVAPPVEGAYGATGDPWPIWRAYTALHDLHRAVPREPFFKSLLGALLLLSIAGLWSTRREGSRGTRRLTLLFGVLVAGVSGGIWLVHQFLGDGAPFLLIGWMPYRLMNHLAILLVPLCAGLLWREPSRAGRILLALAGLQLVATPLWGTLLPEIFFQRYVERPEGVMFLLCGGVLASLFCGVRARRRRWLIVAALFVVLVWQYPFALAGIVAGGVLWLVARQWVTRATSVRRFASGAAVLAGVLLLMALLAREYRDRDHLGVQPIHGEVAAWLSKAGESEAMIVTPYWDEKWLGKIRHPVLADYQTAHLMSYVPSLAPGLKKLHEEVFGFVIDGPTGPPLSPWPGRDGETWRALGRAYGFRYVLAPSEITLQLEQVLEGQPYDLYRVFPEGE